MRRDDKASTSGAGLFTNLKDAFFSFLDDKSPMLGASIAYFTLFSISPLLLILIAVVGFFFGRNEVEHEITRQLEALLGPESAQLVNQIIAQTTSPGSGWIALIVGIVVLLIGATGIFRQLKDAINMIWSVEPKPDISLWSRARQQFLSFAMIAVIGFILMVSLVASAVISILNTYFQQLVPFSGFVMQAISLFVSFWIIMLLFAFIYKVLSDIKIPWNYIWGGATVAAIMFVFGKELIGLYIANSAITSTYGAASSLVVLLVWVYYSAQIVLFGASYIKVSTANRGIVLAPEKYAVKTKEVKVENEKEDDFSEIERFIIYSAGRLFRDVALKFDKRFLRPEKTFWQRVQEKLKE